ncbi:MAG: UDP-N-acetylglucosamine--N-acetylmuramyl-(pentapeptide) pyrophosphoryl-undecaprenol N-acetylglucosamine transferase [Candidatus Harrisonbacteria bacterium]|nr:UDP-N-acetylglucosamine--N-acetylmuramyl-(pentapeptide) pyrophosphoryl-undecaprenol N-acetylglucosamine transferase [Candidatus Harrisonbacteria bacterium]
MKKLRVLLTGGGTGGHVYPIIAVSQKLRDWAEKNVIGADLRYFGAIDGYRPTLEAAKIKVVKITTSKLRRYFSFLNFLDFFRFWIGFFQSLVKIFFYMPEVAFSKGGPGALPVVLACRFYFIPIVVHESDTSPGLTNKISTRSAKVLDLAFDSAASNFPKRKGTINIVGNPVRTELLSVIPKEQAKKTLGFDANRPLVLILGGSQGAEKINDFVLNGLELLLTKYQALHQVGPEKYAEYKQQYAFISKNFSPLLTRNYRFSSYFEKELGLAMDAADVIISRAGAGAIFEIAAKGKPSILIPFPEAARNHQTQNAYEYAKTGAAIVIEQENLLSSIVISQIDRMLNDPRIIEKMSTAAKNFYRPDAAEKIATHILELWRQ